jgi:hypothetical protein
MTRRDWDRERRQRPLREHREPDLGPAYGATEQSKGTAVTGKRNYPAATERDAATPPLGLRIAAEPNALLQAAVYRVFTRDWPSFQRWMLERLSAYDGAVVCRAQERLAVAGYVPAAGDLLALHQPDLAEDRLHQLGFSDAPRPPFSGHWWTLALQPPATHHYRDIAAFVSQALATSSPRTIRWTFGQLGPDVSD